MSTLNLTLNLTTEPHHLALAAPFPITLLLGIVTQRSHTSRHSSTNCWIAGKTRRCFTHNAAEGSGCFAGDACFLESLTKLGFTELFTSDLGLAHVIWEKILVFFFFPKKNCDLGLII